MQNLSELYKNLNDENAGLVDKAGTSNKSGGGNCSPEEFFLFEVIS